MNLMKLRNYKMSDIENYSNIEITVDKYKNEGVELGATGYIIAIRKPGEAYEIEFSLPNGETYAQIVAHPSEFKVKNS